MKCIIVIGIQELLWLYRWSSDVKIFAIQLSTCFVMSKVGGDELTILCQDLGADPRKSGKLQIGHL